MNVKAAPGLQCPMEGQPKSYITETQVVPVPDTAYYRRLVDDGSLVEAPLESAKSPKNERGGEQ